MHDIASSFVELPPLASFSSSPDCTGAEDRAEMVGEAKVCNMVCA